MALDLGKKLSLGDIKGASKKTKKSEYPQKTYINLVQVDRKTIDMRRTALTGIVVVVLLALFAKFGVIDFYARLDAKKAELGAQTAQLTALQSQLANYNAVLEEYEGYESMSLSGDGMSVNALAAIDLVETYVAPSASVGSLSLTGNELSLSLTDVSLDGVGQIANTLKEQSMVQDVVVFNASTRNSDNGNTTASMKIVLASSDAKSSDAKSSGSKSSGSK